MRISARFLILLFAGMICLSACNPIKTAQNRERMHQLRTVANTYRKLMRWGHYDQAVQYLKTRDESVEAPDFEMMERFKITNYTIADQIVNDSEFDAKITAYIDFYDIDSGVAKAAKDDQYWWYDEQEKRWYLGSPMINFAELASRK